MAVISEEVFKSRIKSGSLDPTYILFGDDGYLKKMYSEKLIKMTQIRTIFLISAVLVRIAICRRFTTFFGRFL